MGIRAAEVQKVKALLLMFSMLDFRSHGRFWSASPLSRKGKKNELRLHGEVEFDELYVVAGHKGQPQKVKQKGRSARSR